MADREEDLYALLGVPRTADADAIKKAYRKLALKHHPDKNPGDKKAEERFKKINHANDVIGDPKKRQIYDEFGEMGLREGFDANRAREYVQWQSQTGSGPDLGSLFGSGKGPVDFDSIFSRFFAGGGAGGGRRAQGAMPFGMGFGGGRGRDLESAISVPFAQAVRGGEMRLTINGEPLTLRVPPGATEGVRLRIAGHGLPSPNGGARGDLMLTLHVEPHPSFWMEGGDLHVHLPVTISEAYRGAKIKMPAPDGELTVKVPARTSSGAKLRLRGKGVPASKNRPATDLIVHVRVAIPEGASAEIDGALDIMEKAYNKDIRADLDF